MSEKELLPSKGYGMTGLGGTVPDRSRPGTYKTMSSKTSPKGLRCSNGCARPRHGLRYTTCQVCQSKIWRGAALKGWRTRKRMTKARARSTAQ